MRCFWISICDMVELLHDTQFFPIHLWYVELLLHFKFKELQLWITKSCKDLIAFLLFAAIRLMAQWKTKGLQRAPLAMFLLAKKR